MMQIIPRYEITFEQQYNDDIRLVGAQHQIENLIKLLMDNGYTTFSVRPAPQNVHTISATFSTPEST